MAFGDCCRENLSSPNNTVADVSRNLINWFLVPADEKFGDN